jgi:hypothetical protein
MAEPIQPPSDLVALARIRPERNEWRFYRIEAWSAVARPWQRSFLGFTDEPQPQRRSADKAVSRFKDRVRELTRRHRGVSLERMIADLNPLLRGWAGYFGFSQWLHAAGYARPKLPRGKAFAYFTARGTRGFDATTTSALWHISCRRIQSSQRRSAAHEGALANRNNGGITKMVMAGIWVGSHADHGYMLDRHNRGQPDDLAE